MYNYLIIHRVLRLYQPNLEQYCDPDDSWSATQLQLPVPDYFPQLDLLLFCVLLNIENRSVWYERSFAIVQIQKVIRKLIKHRSFYNCEVLKILQRLPHVHNTAIYVLVLRLWEWMIFIWMDSDGIDAHKLRIKSMNTPFFWRSWELVNLTVSSTCSQYIHLCVFPLDISLK